MIYFCDTNKKDSTLFSCTIGVFSRSMHGIERTNVKIKNLILIPIKTTVLKFFLSRVVSDFSLCVLFS